MRRFVVALIAVAAIAAGCTSGAGEAGWTAVPPASVGPPGASSTFGPSAPASPSPTSTPAGSPIPIATASPAPTFAATPGPSPTPVATPAATAGSTSAPTLAPTAPSTLPPATASPAASPSATPDDPRVLVDLPVIPCEVTDGGLPGPAATPSMTVATIEIPLSLVPQVTWYGIGEDELVLGPAGWTCEAAIGANGSERIVVASPSDPDAAVIFQAYPGAPVESLLELACPLFEAAAAALLATFGTACPKASPAEEIVTRPSPQVAEFVDPPGVEGLGARSGGAYPVIGAIVYHDDGADLQLAYQVSCVAPPSEERLCRSLTFDWVERLGFTATAP